MRNDLQIPETACPSDRDLQDFIDGVLDSIKLHQVILHLSACERCESLVAKDRSECERSLGTLRNADVATELWSESEFQRMCTRAKNIARGEQLPDHSQDLQRIGHYFVVRKLGEGAFATVYLAREIENNRLLAIKVPKLNKLAAQDAMRFFQREAALVKELDHPSISKVFECNQDDSGCCYIAMQYVEGKSLRQVLDTERISHRRAVRIAIEISDALQYAHRKQIYHRDVKPTNIIIGLDDTPYLIDFGLAIHERDRWLYQNQRAGTENYMSPEQVRGESHRLDGRTDIWSLGAVLYEMLTGSILFEGTQAQIFDEILHRERSPRIIDPAVPPELERICLKCLSKRISNRFTTAQDLAADLRAWMEQSSSVANGEHQSRTASIVVPKGPRPFDENDAEFYLDLLPGPRARDGLPESVRFWKNKVEATTVDDVFPVGLVYGPSGGGKSSFIKAGLLPRLGNSVVPIYLLATPENTEVQLLSALRQRIPSISENALLPKLLADIRSGRYLLEGQKVLLVFDQFEQWLHSRTNYGNELLVQSLRHCNGRNLQALVIVRDDFWMAVTRFFRALEIDLFDGGNSAAVDRFDQVHARKVLCMFGRAYGALPNSDEPLTDAQEEFLDQSVRLITEGGTVVCVHLALFAEMVKSRPWIPSTLKDAGSAEGIGLAFLEGKFGPNSNPKHRLHANAAREILRELLPNAGVDIRGSAKTSAQLRAVSSYADKNKQFSDLLKLLDVELRLIARADLSAGSDDADEVMPDLPQAHYQLTHDFLVPAVRKWIFHKQLETRRGRAELILDQRTRMWQTHQEQRPLPTWIEWMSISTFTKSMYWTESQRKMMRSAGRVYGIRWGIAGLVLMAVAAGFMARDRVNHRLRTEILVKQVLAASADGLPYSIQTLVPVSAYAVPMLEKEFQNRDAEPRERLHAAIALANFENVKLDFLASSIDQAADGECTNIISALSHERASATKKVTAFARDASSREQWRLKARLAIVAAHLGDASMVQDMLRQRADPSERTVLIDTLPNWHGSVQQLVEIARSSNESTCSSGISLGVGNIALTDLHSGEVEDLRALLSDWYENEPDGGTHSAAGWALNQLKMAQPNSPQPKKIDGYGWHVNSIGMTMLTVHSGNFTRYIKDGNSPSKTARRQQTVSLTRAFYASDREVSRQQFQVFMDDNAYPSELKPKIWKGAEVARSPSREHPVQSVSWIDAVQFCNWLSVREGLATFYELNGTNWEAVEDSEGYRLPSEAEWEYICRAGTNTEYASGNDESLLRKFAVYQANQTEICGSRMPNGWGFFDLHGNVFEWCQDWWDKSHIDVDRIDNPDGPGQGTQKVLRGGAFDYSSKIVSSARRDGNRTEYRSYTIGFRPVRSYR